MRLYHKLLLGFLLAAFLVAVVSYISLSLHKNIEQGVLHLNESSLQEMENAARMALALQASQTAIQELMEEHHSLGANVQNEAHVRVAIDLAEQDIKKHLTDFKMYLERSRSATLLGVNYAEEANEVEEVEEEEEELGWLDRLTELFQEYEASTNAFQSLLSTDLHQADAYLEDELEPHYRETLLPLIEKYWEDARDEFEEEGDEIQENVTGDGQIIVGASFLAVLLAVVLGLLVARHIAKPLTRLAEAAQAIGKRDLDEHIDVKSHDEVGQLATAFNQMIDDLSHTTVSKAYVDNIIDSMADSLIVVSDDGHILRVNQATLALLHYAEEDLLGHQIARVFGWVEARVNRLIQQTKHHGYVANQEVVYRTDAGDEIPVLFSSALMQEDDGRVLGIVCVAQDITERKQFEKELIHARHRAEEMVRLKNSFIDNMSHEIRTPLQGVLSAAQILKEEATEHLLEFVEIIEISSNRLLHTLSSVLDLAQIESGELLPQLAVLNVWAEAQRAVRAFQLLAEQKGLVLQLDVIDPATWVRLDPGFLDRILNNLIGNAIKYTETGNVIVEVTSDATDVCLRVRDTGIGIDKPFLPHLFDSFKQESTGIGRSHEGNGLGLTIMKKLIDLMGGRIEVESIKGLGSAFSVYFPKIAPPAGSVEDDSAAPLSALDAPAPAAHTEQRAVVPKRADAPPHILCVEDQHETVVVTRHILRFYDISIATTPDEALAHAQTQSFDLLLIDINLKSDKTGVDLLHTLRQMPAHRTTPAIAATAYAMPGNRERFLEAGFDYYLSKPYMKNELLDIVEQALAGRHPGSTRQRPAPGEAPRARSAQQTRHRANSPTSEERA